MTEQIKRAPGVQVPDEMIADVGDSRAYVDGFNQCRRQVLELNMPAPQGEVPAPSDAHPDDVAVDHFAAAMKAKLAEKRTQGRGGWNDPAACSVERLAHMLVEHVSKGDPVDVANFAMMLHMRGAGREVLAAAAAPSDADAKDAAWLPFDYKNPPPEDLYWVVCEGPDYDTDVDSEGRTAGWPNGGVIRDVALVSMGIHPGGFIEFDPVDHVNYGLVYDEQVVTHFMPVTKPAAPATAAQKEGGHG